MRRAGYGVVYDGHRQRSRTVSKPLSGIEQTAQRAELRAVLAALSIENRPLHIKSNSKYVVDGLQNILTGTPLPVDGENLDLWKQVAELISRRCHPVRISWVKGHATDMDVHKGISTFSDQIGNDAADKAAVSGTAQHSCPPELALCYSQHQHHSIQIALMYTEIAVARNKWAKQHKLLTYAPKKKSETQTDGSTQGIDTYLFHTGTGQTLLPRFKNFPTLKKSFRFPFGELAWNALTWYLTQLKWPKDDAGTLGITWIELAIDFELSTGVTLPRGAETLH